MSSSRRALGGLPLGRSLSVVLAISAVAAAGCGGGDPFTRIESTYDGMVNDLCRSCPAVAGASTEAECRTTAMGTDPFTGAEWDCQRTAYQQYSNELGPYYDCVARAVTGFDRCMRDATRTCPPASGSSEACGDAMSAAIRACPPPDSIMASQALSACFSM